MAKRDFDAEFSRITSQFAAQDAELVEHFQSRMSGEAGETSDAVMEAMIRTQYDLDTDSYRLAVAKCIGGLAGISLGSEFFGE